METDKTAILILNWMHPEETIRCLTHLFDEARDAIVVIVENGSNDHSIEIIRNKLRVISIEKSMSHLEESDVVVERFGSDCLDILFVLSPVNRGFAGGMNLAAHVAIRAGANSLFLLNNDAEIKMSDIFELKKISANNGNAIVGPLLCDFFRRDKILFSGYKWPHLLFGLGKNNVERKYLAVWRTGYVEGSALFIPALFLSHKMQQDGYLFDEAYYLYCEDVDLSLSAQKLGFQCLITSTVKAYHKVSVSSGGKGNASAYYYITRNRIFLARAWLGQSLYSVFFAYYLLSRMLLFSGRILTKEGRHTNTVVFRGLRDGILGRCGPEK